MIGEKERKQDWDVSVRLLTLFVEQVMSTAPSECNWPQVAAVMPLLNTSAPFTAKAAFLQPAQDKESD